MHGLLLAAGLIAAATGALIPAANGQSAYRGNQQAGKQLALRTCDACHVVARDQEYPPLVQGYAPSFFQIANEPETSAAALRAFLAHPHVLSRMPYPDLTANQIDDISAYILSLRGRR